MRHAGQRGRRQGSARTVARATPESTNCGGEEGKVVPHGGRDDRVVGVEVPVGEMVPHTRDVVQGTAGSADRTSGGISLTASPISSKHMRTAS